MLNRERSFAPPDSRGGCPYVVLAMLKGFYRRKLPHLQRDGKPHFVTFCTAKREILPESVRPIVLDCCLHDHGIKYDLHAAVIKPDHVHLVFTPLLNQLCHEIYSLAEIMDALKGASAHKVNRALGRTGKLWQTESFDRVLRCSEKLDEKITYILNNPGRKGIAARPIDCPWLWAADWEIGTPVALRQNA